jgi:ABC-type molybdate transport system substrate-binding protein
MPEISTGNERLLVSAAVIRTVALTLLCLLGAACGPTGGKGDRSGGHRAEARIYAAASLIDVIGALGRQFEPLRGSHVVPSFGASNTLAQQLREGAPPGVFVSASVEWVDKLEGWGLVEPGSRVELMGNSLVVGRRSSRSWRTRSSPDWRSRTRSTSRPASTPRRRWRRPGCSTR